MRLAFCAACGSAEDLQHHHLVTRAEGGSDDERNLRTRSAVSATGSCASGGDGPTAADRLKEGRKEDRRREEVGRLRAEGRNGEEAARRRRFLRSRSAS